MNKPLGRFARKLAAHWPAVAIFAGFILLWQLAVSFLGMREYLLPSPMSVLRAMFSDEIPWSRHIWVTAAEIIGAHISPEPDHTNLRTVHATTPIRTVRWSLHR